MKVDSVAVARPRCGRAPTLGERILAAILDVWFTLRDLCILVVIPGYLLMADLPGLALWLSGYYGIAMKKSWEDRNYTSLGKTKMGLKVVNHADGKRISHDQAYYRPFAYVFI